ncbi:MAG TPA: glucuronate isomerase [Micropruina sp.]|jgi:glucuronate isomerase|nr:glucuronate isomerase [Micropruina sp.]
MTFAPLLLRTEQPLALHPDRMLPGDPRQRAVARTIYASVQNLPIISMHGHVDAAVFADNPAFADPAQLLIVPDHYVCRLLYAQGMRPEQLGIPRADGGRTETDSRTIWRHFCANWKLLRGTPSRYWLEHEFGTVFGLTEQPSADNADDLYDQLAAVLADPGFRPQQLLDRFDIELISSTDPAGSDLAAHARLHDQGLGARVLPTFRPDAVVYLDRADWQPSIDALAEASGIDVSTYAGYLDALRERRRAFVAMGALATDHGHYYADTTPLPDAVAAELYGRRVAGGQVSDAEVHAFAAHMLFQMAAMSVEDGLVMQIHPGVHRDHHSGVFAAHGQDKGFDIPFGVEYTRALRPMLDAFGTDPRFRCIVFTIDETAYSRELAPMAGAYPALKLGAPWWFIDSPGGMLRFFESATETAGFYNMAGFVDDTRAYCSIPARHDLYRRISAAYLSRLVIEHRLGEDEAVETAIDLAYHLPKLSYQRR